MGMFDFWKKKREITPRIVLFTENDENEYLGDVRLDSSFLRFAAKRNERKITICDIQCIKNNRGTGTYLMDKLIEYARENNFAVIDGWISEVDIDHIDRLEHFYGKFGFLIKHERDGIKIATIELKI